MKILQKIYGKSVLSSETFYLPCLILLLQFFFKFAQGQGPGSLDLSVSENEPPGTEVGKIETESSFTFHISNDSVDANYYFRIDPITGLITTKVIIDRESLNLQENKFSVLILGTGGSITVPFEATIEILDENDNGPIFPADSETVHFREDVDNGTQRYIAIATDADDGVNALVNHYNIISGDGPFKIVFDPVVYGEVLIIETTGILDREKISLYTLTIEAKDSGFPQNSGVTVVIIEIEDVNDNAPMFAPSELYAQVNETDQIGTFVIQLRALDLDTGVNQDIEYKIASDDEGSDQFRIENSTGKIFTTLQPLSCPDGQCHLNIKASDKGIPSYSTRAFVFITVIDINNHDPVIKFKYVPTGNENFSSVNEDATDGTIVAGVFVTDADDGASPSAEIIAGNEVEHFRFELYTSGIYYVKVNGDVLDMERQQLYNLTVEARDGGNPPRMSTTALLIYVNDINDHAPGFSKKKVHLSISEITKVGSRIVNMLATDLDDGINAKLTYIIETGNNPEWFHIDKDTGLVTTRATLHYEQQNYFHMNISVHDGAQKPLRDFAELEILIWDENDMAPQFSQSIFNASLDENLAKVSPVVSASAVDYDSGVNGTIVYQFHSHVELLYPNTFHIDSATGEVTTKKTLDREEIPNYTIEIIAKDKGPSPLTSTATVYLKVLDINDNSPIFYPKRYYANIIEGQGQGTEVITVTATDLDEGENAEIVYSFSGSDFGKFLINSTSGIITTVGTFHMNIKSSYLLNVAAKDKLGQNVDSAYVHVSIVSPTDPQPQFNSKSYKFTITEDPGTSSPINIGVSVGRVTAQADSSQSSIAYIVIAGDPTKVFSLDAVTGWIRRSKGIDRELFPIFNLKVVATVGEKFAETEVIITIKDDNDNAPVFEFPYLDMDVIENWPVGHYIALISATDADESGPNSRVSYSLQRDQNNVFGVQSDTGLLYLNKPVKLLGNDSVTLTVVAMDSGTPTFTGSQEIRLKIKDVNNHTPKFAHRKYEKSLIESHAVNSMFFHVVAVDDDLGENGQLTYNITRGNEDKRFGIFPDGNLYIAKQLDRETKDLYKLSITARDHGIQQRSSECNITIHITDFNDNKPIFLNATYGLDMLENKRSNTFVGYVQASDDDMGRNAELSYSFKNHQADFHIDSQSGEITSLKVFDREELADSDYMVIFDVVVKDNGFHRLEDVASVRVTILDENDNSPVFKNPIYKVTKFENEASLSNITVVKADDADAGINSIVTYSIIAGNIDGKFAISQTSGQITLAQQLDRETVDFYELTILATDSGEIVRHNATCKVQIFVSDINDNFPLFAHSQMDITVVEDVEPGNEVAHFPATDTDIGVNAEIVYKLSGKDDNGMFGIDNHTGKIYLQKKLDFESKTNYKLNVTATDKGVPALPYYIRFSITIEDVNDNSPVFENEPLAFTIDENSSGSVTTIHANDADSGKNGEVQYHIAYQDPPGENFKIVKNSGQIYIDKQIDREVANIFKLRVVATDQAVVESKRLTTEALVTIYIADKNDNDPVVTSCNAIAVPLSTPRNEYITTITVQDKDSGNNGKFSVLLTQTGTNIFSLDSNSGRLLLTGSLPDMPLKYSVTVRATDYGTIQRTSEAALVIIVTRNESGTMFQSTSYSGTVTENSVVGKSILHVKALSQHSAVEYYVTNVTHSETGRQVDRYFEVHRTTGELTTAQELDREVVGNSFDVEIYGIETSGSQPRTSVTKVHIELLDVNDTPPRFSQNYYTVYVDENVQPDFIVTKVAVYDDDSIGGLQLTLNVDSGVNLKINQDGTIVTTGYLDRETTPQYTLRVTATDGIQSSSCIVRIHLKDVNDNAPKFTQSIYSFDILEDTLIGTTVGSVRAHDPDEGDNGIVTYSFGWVNDTFGLDAVKGTFTLLRLLDFEENQLYTVNVNARDSGDPAKTSSVLVYFNVKDTNDNTPLFEHGMYDVAISENVTIGSSVVQVLALDVDSGLNGEVSYSISDGDVAGQFGINPSNGTIYTVMELDRETAPSYNLIVMATDMANVATDMANTAATRRTATTEVLLTIMDVNDYVPVVTSPAVIVVRENTPFNTVVHAVTVRDLDEGVNSQVEFSIISKSGGTPFTCGTSDGKLRVNTDLDRESVQNYTVMITVRDLGSPSLSSTQNVLVKIEDENDHSPVFSPEFYDKEVREDVPIGTTLLQVFAMDIDIGLNGIVKFFVITGDNNSDFSLDQSSGVLRVQKSLDYERVTHYNLVIQAEDSGDDMHHSTATVSITVLDVNDNVPMFLDSPYIGFVRENMDSLPVHVLNVLAHDEDSPPFNQLSYAIREGDRNLFNMSSTTGEIMVLKRLDREVKSEYMLTVVATDSATGRVLTGSGTVSVFIEDVNDNPPVFDHVGRYVAHISENADENTEVTVVRATDKDEGSNADIRYSLIDTIYNRFMIYPDTGRIATRVTLNREEVSEYTLQVIARDTSLLPLSSTTTVIVHVDDENDNEPQFSSESYSRDMLLPFSTGAFVVGVTASDLDSGDNKIVEYVISEPDATYFNIDIKTGVITTRLALSLGRTYNFQVTANDKGSPVLSSSVPVIVSTSSSTGITAPTFDLIPTNLKVMENMAVEHNVTMVMATSSNNAAVVYSIVGGNLANAFGIESTSGRIHVTGSIDYEVIQQYHLWVEASERGASQVSSFAEVLIDVEDVNDNEPRFSKVLYIKSIAEDIIRGTGFVTVTATDADSGNNGAVTYSLSGTDHTSFRINPQTGQITTYTSLDRETKDMYSLTVTATDSGSIKKSSTASVRIPILDVNDESPAFTRQFRVKIAENMQVGSFVLRVTSSDHDIGQNAVATYSLPDDAGGIFAIEGVSGNITLQRTLDAEVLSAYTLRVSATDGAHDVQGNVEVDVTDVNDNTPILTKPVSFHFEEMMPAGSLVGKLHATDEDISTPNNKVYFSLKLASSYFDLDSDTGIITSLEELTFDPSVELTSLPNRHELVVIVKDLGTPVRSSEHTVHVNVVDYNDHAPVFEHAKYESAVPETTREGNSIISVHAIDEFDYGDNAKVEYFLTGGNGSSMFNVDRFSGKLEYIYSDNAKVEYFLTGGNGSLVFSVDRFTGIIAVSTSLIGNAGKKYIVIIKAEDKGSNPKYSTVDVRLVVTDDNRFAPSFVAPATKQITVYENKDIGSLVETFSAQDSDRSLNAEVIYEITGGNEDEAFNLDRKNGVLSVKGILDYDLVKQYTLDITAKDKALHPKETTISYTVRLRDVNDNDPIFAQTIDKVFVDENSPVRTSVYHAVAVDNDSGDNAVIRYAIVSPQVQNKFEINERTGVVTTVDDLDYELRDMYTLTIMALNPDSSRKSTMSLTVHIEGVNEFVPEFVKDLYRFSISESAAANTSVGQVLATDDDAGPDGVVNYFLIGDSNARGFKIDPRTGVILVSGQPDYESSPSIQLEVLAKNWGSVQGNDTDTCMVYISVQDANDPPRFSQDVYQSNVLENSGADTSVMTVVAEDYDYEPTDRIFSYVILTGNSDSFFKMNSKTGYISTTGKGTLDREIIPVHIITVGAVDTGSPPETGSAMVHIYLDDVNDNGPAFFNFTAKVTEGQDISTLVTTLTQFTTDPDDAGNQEPYTYRKLAGSHVEYDYFEIDTTGKVRTKKVLDRESIPEFNIPVIVQDGGSPTQTSTLSFKIMVSDINDTPPSARFLTIFLSVYNGKHPDGAIADVRPVDQDIDGRPRCSLLSTNTPFSIIPGSCNLLLNTDPTQSSYTLEIQGMDNIFDPITYDVSVKVTSFDNITLEHSTIIQIAGTNANVDLFMKNSYTNFVSSVKNLFESQDEVVVYGLLEESGDLLVYLAVKKAGVNEYYYPANLIQKLINAKTDIQSAAHIFIVDVAYSKCSSVQCKNGGACTSHVTVGVANQNADSLSQAFSNPSLYLISECSCPAEYTGPDCSISAKPCGSTFCQNGGVCVGDGNQKRCSCSPEWTGRNCGSDVNECQQNVCNNGGTCENIAGSFICHCVSGFFGKMCEEGKNYCMSDPCVKGTCKNMVDKFRCECPYSYWGQLCQLTSLGFAESSFMVFPKLSELNNEIEVIFATESDRALLLYNPSYTLGSNEFIALEILNGRIRFSVALGADATRIDIDKRVDTGSWFKVKVNRNRDMSRVWVEDCPEDGGPCKECQIGTACYSQQQTQHDQRLEVGNHPLLIGGVKTIDTILNRSGEVSSHDFVGCIRSFVINGQDILTTTPNEQSAIINECPRKSSDDVCRSYECKNGGICVRAWSRPVCYCTSRYSGPHCEEALNPFQFGPDSLVRITMKESVRRDTKLDAAANSRRRRATVAGGSSVLIRFRTSSNYGVLFFASTLKESKFSVLSVFDGQLKFTVKQYGGSESVTVVSPQLSDGRWHNATVTVSPSEVRVSLDGGQPTRSAISAFPFSSHEIKELTLGGISSAVNSITIDNEILDDLSGCISLFELDGEQLPMNGTTAVYNIQAVGGVGNGCTSLCENNVCEGNGCTVEGEAVVCAIDEDILSIGIIIMIIFFVILLIAIVIVFVVFRQRRKLCMKAKHQKQNGTTFSNSANSSGQSNPDSGYGENNIDKLIIRNHIAQELAGSNYQRQNGQLMKPDIIKSDMGRSPMPLEMEDGTVIIDNASDMTHLHDLNGEMPEHYDLENASSIAPSDIDVVDHYRHFHDGGRSRRKNKTHSDHSHHSKHSSRHYPSSHGSSHHVLTDSPNLLTSVPYLNDLARGSPANTRNSPINQLSRQSPNVRQSPLTHVNMHGHNMPVTDLTDGSRATSERSLASHRSKNLTPSKPKRQMLPNGQPLLSQKGINHSYENSKFLTLEEVDRLNARPHESPASLMEAFSTSSDNNTRNMQKPFQHYRDTSVLLEPPESSSDDSANDSFTCSEFEFENDKPKNDFDPNNRIFSNLTEVENENEDGAYHNKNFKADGLDSGGNSFSSNERCSDDNQGQSKIPNTAFNWDDLLNWGPKFEKLVGVFTDIALLPDANSVDFVEVEAKGMEHEEYV